jgi:hypothetical protein
MRLTKAADLAAEWGIEEADFHRLRRKNRWPHVRLGRFDVRFTDAQVEQIVAMQTRAPGERKPTNVRPLTGQTPQSARRSR